MWVPGSFFAGSTICDQVGCEDEELEDQSPRKVEQV
jgi:hypothetical protein